MHEVGWLLSFFCEEAASQVLLSEAQWVVLSPLSRAQESYLKGETAVSTGSVRFRIRFRSSNMSDASMTASLPLWRIHWR
jgi:hypothetical protein